MRLPRGTVTLLFTDVVGSTRLLHELGRTAYAAALSDHRRLLRDAFAARGGVEVEMQGDSFHFAFPLARDAVEAAVAAQRALAEHEWQSSPLAVRIGIHTGEPIVADELYTGMDVHRAARVMSVGHGGQILLTERTADLVEGELPPDLDTIELGEYSLKDLDRPIRICQVVAPGIRSAFPPLNAERVTPRDQPPPAGTRTRVSLSGTRRRIGGLMTALVAAVALAAALAAVVSTGDTEAEQPKRRPIAIKPNSIAVIDPKSNRLVAGIPVGIAPTRVAVAGSRVWILNRDDQTISLIDARSKELVKTFGVGVPPIGLAADAKHVWIGTAGKRNPTDIEDAARAPGSIIELDATSRHVNRTLNAPPLPAPPARTADMGPLALGAEAVWFLSGNQTVSRVNLASDTVAARMRYTASGLGVSQPSITVGEGAVWVSAVDGASGGTLTRIDPGTNDPVAEIAVPAAGSVAAGLGAVWIADQWYDTESVWTVDPGSNRVIGSVRVGPFPFGLAVGAGAVWATSTDGTVSKIDPASRTVRAKIRVGGTPTGIAVGAGFVWVAIS